MKRIGCLCLAAAVLLSVTACGGSGASSVSSSVPEVSSSSAETAEVSAALQKQRKFQQLIFTTLLMK